MFSEDIIKFAKTFFVILICLICLDFIIGMGLKMMYFNQQSGLLYRTTYSIEKTTSDLVIFGSS